jgi:hypothetical protein
VNVNVQCVNLVDPNNIINAIKLTEHLQLVWFSPVSDQQGIRCQGG